MSEMAQPACAADYQRLEQRPVIVTGPGQYLTRTGNLVLVDKVRSKEETNATFNVTGYLFKHRPGHAKPSRTWYTWHPCGALRAVKDSCHDIVAVATPEQALALLANAPPMPPTV